MASNYWAKLYIEILDDPKMGRLRDRLWRRVVECILMAKELDDEGRLPAVADMAWRLRTDPELLEAELLDLVAVGILQHVGPTWTVTNYNKRQGPVSDAERMRRMRNRQKSRQYYGSSDDAVTEPVTGGVTNRNTETDKDSGGGGEAAAVYCAFEQNIAALTPVTSEAIGAAISDYSADWVMTAIETAAKANARNWNYIAAILKRWQAAGFKDTGPKPTTATSGNGHTQGTKRQAVKQRSDDALAQFVEVYGEHG